MDVLEITVVCADEGCSNTFVPKRRGRPRLYCDDCPTKAAYNRRWRAGITNPIPRKRYVPLLPCEATCEGCGDTYTKTWGPQLYCGQPCGEFVTATCAGCGDPFEGRARDRDRVLGWGRFCSRSCALSKRRLSA